MKNLQKNQGGYSLIGLWPWTGVYSSICLFLTIKLGFIGFIVFSIFTVYVIKIAAATIEISSKQPEPLEKTSAQEPLRVKSVAS